MLEIEPIVYTSAQSNERGTRPRVATLRGYVASDTRCNQVRVPARALALVGAMGAGLLASACAATTPTPTSSPVQTASPALSAGVTAASAGTHALQVIGAPSSLAFTVVLPPGWFDLSGTTVDKYPETGKPRPVLGLSVWDVGQVVRDPCHWQDQAFTPGPSVEDLAAALAAQKTRDATTPTAVTLAGYAGEYLQWSVPADLTSSKWTDFDACDLSSDGVDRDFVSWFANGSSQDDRYEEVPGEVDQLWVLEVNGQRLVVDATYSPDTSQADRRQLAQVVNSLQFGVH
jgi:hypothetical protein